MTISSNPKWKSLEQPEAKITIHSLIISEETIRWKEL